MAFTYVISNMIFVRAHLSFYKKNRKLVNLNGGDETTLKDLVGDGTAVLDCYTTW